MGVENKIPLESGISGQEFWNNLANAVGIGVAAFLFVYWSWKGLQTQIGGEKKK